MKIVNSVTDEKPTIRKEALGCIRRLTELLQDIFQDENWVKI